MFFCFLIQNVILILVLSLFVIYCPEFLLSIQNGHIFYIKRKHLKTSRREKNEPIKKIFIQWSKIVQPNSGDDI